MDWSKLEAFADDKINVNKNRKFGLGSVEIIVGRGESYLTAELTLQDKYFHNSEFKGGNLAR